MTEQRSAEALAYRHLYKTKRWQALRRAQLRAQPLCIMCLKAGRFTPATVCDHVDPKAKTPATFFNGPFQSLCAPHHNSAKQREEKRGYSGEVDADGWPTDVRHPANRSR